uniref:KN motif and ankyrin repeat domains 1b n=1 Tax=Takifugu rubripes TaxID=31033 RepID=A0A674NDW6_TAKRU
ATIKRLSLRRRPRVAVSDVEKTHGSISHTQWQSAESLSSSDARLLGMLSSVTADRPPRPPSHTSSSDSKVCRNEDLSESVVSKESKPQPAARSLSKTPIPETHKQTDQEVSNQVAPQPRPRQRLASFGGVSSPSSASPFTGLGAYNQASNRSTAAGNETHAKLSSSLGSRGSTGCLRMSPESSGRTTPVPNLGPTHLQHVRDQMVAALQKLKELEEQVKIIPILQVRISVLQEEKRQLASQLKTQSDAEGFNRGLKDVERNDGAEYRQPTEEMRALEATEFITSTTNSFYFLVRTGHSPPQSSPDSSKCDLNPETFITRGSEVKRMIQVLEEQTSSVLRGEYVTCACHCSVFILHRI